MNKTLQNSSQTEKTTCEQLLECEKCNFKEKTKKEFVKHKKNSHNWCSVSFSSLNSLIHNTVYRQFLVESQPIPSLALTALT